MKERQYCDIQYLFRYQQSRVSLIFALCFNGDFHQNLAVGQTVNLSFHLHLRSNFSTFFERRSISGLALRLSSSKTVHNEFLNFFLQTWAKFISYNNLELIIISNNTNYYYLIGIFKLMLCFFI